MISVGLASWAAGDLIYTVGYVGTSVPVDRGRFLPGVLPAGLRRPVPPGSGPGVTAEHERLAGRVAAALASAAVGAAVARRPGARDDRWQRVGRGYEPRLPARGRPPPRGRRRRALADPLARTRLARDRRRACRDRSGRQVYLYQSAARTYIEEWSWTPLAASTLLIALAAWQRPAVPVTSTCPAARCSRLLRPPTRGTCAARLRPLRATERARGCALGRGGHRGLRPHGLDVREETHSSSRGAASWRHGLPHRLGNRRSSS